MNVPSDNAKHFQDDAVWVKHCQRMADYYNSIPPITSKPGWDGRKS